MCGRTGEIISLGEGRPIRCPTCFRHGWVQRRDAPSNQSPDTEKESLTEAEQPNERSVDSLNSEEEERLTQAKQPDEESAGNLSDEGKEMLESLLEEVNRRAQRPKQPSEEKKGTENRSASSQRQPSKATSRGDIRLGPHNPYYGQPLEKQSSESRPPPLKGRPLHQKSGRSPLWPIVGVIMVVALIFVAYIVMDRRDRPVANESLREPDTVARIVEDRTNHPGTADRSKESDDAARIVRDEAPRPDPRSSTSTLATPTPKPTELLTVNPTATSTGTYASDRIVLVALYNKMGGSGWRNSTNWLSDAPIGEWHGVTTDDSGRVIELDLKNNQLGGALPPELSSLSTLEDLNLGGNQLTGAIPSELSALSRLTVLELWRNQFSGAIPAELGGLTNLQSLWVGRNQLSGPIPPELGSLSNLKVLELSGNQLTGGIPSELGDLISLKWLSLGGTNQLTGCIPESWRDVQAGDLGTLGLPFCTGVAGTAPTPSPAAQPDRVAVPSATEGQTDDSESNPEPVPRASATFETNELLAYALDLINKDRKDHGLPPVLLGSNPAAQMHAEDMLAYDYIGHWWADGRKPYIVYSETGGRSYAHENVATSGWTSHQWTAKNCDSFLVTCEVPTVRDAIREHQWGMMYDDAHADWGHRDNILGETHRAVNIGIASNGRRVTFVQHFEGGDVTAATRPTLSPDGNLSFSVSKIADGIAIAPLVSIYSDPPPTPKTPEQIQRLHSYCVGGGFTEGCGEPVAEVLEPPPPGSFYTSLQGNEVVADEWTETSRAFSFSASLGNLIGAPGVYTVVIWRDSPNDLFTEVLVELSVTKP